MATTRTITQTHEPKPATGAGKPYLFLAFKCDRPLEGGARFSLEGADVVTLGRGGSLQVDRVREGGATTLRISVPDGRMSALHARLQRVLGSWVIEDLGSKNGTLIDGKRVTTSMSPRHGNPSSQPQSLKELYCARARTRPPSATMRSTR